MGSFVAACELLVAACVRDLIPRPGMERGPPALGAQSLSHWSTREVPGGATSKMAHSRGGQGSTISRRLQLLTTCTSPWGCLSVLTTWQLAAPKQVIPGSKVGATVSFIISVVSCWLHRSVLMCLIWEGANTRRQGSLGASRESGHHTPPP